MSSTNEWIEMGSYVCTVHWAQVTETALNVYNEELVDSLELEVDDLFGFETFSGEPFCGCDTCWTREHISLLWGQFARGMLSGHIKLKSTGEEPWFVDTVKTEEVTTPKANGSKIWVENIKRKLKPRSPAISSAKVDATANTTSPSHNPIEFIFNTEPGDDLTWAGPTCVCLCGGQMFHTLVWFDEDTREVGGRILEMKCASCDALVKGPTPIDEGIDND